MSSLANRPRVAHPPRPLLTQVKGQKIAKDKAYVSTCKLCPDGIYLGQRRAWLAGVLVDGAHRIGLVHAECAEQRGIEVATDGAA